MAIAAAEYTSILMDTPVEGWPALRRDVKPTDLGAFDEAASQVVRRTWSSQECSSHLLSALTRAVSEIVLARPLRAGGAVDVRRLEVAEQIIATMVAVSRDPLGPCGATA